MKKYIIPVFIFLILFSCKDKVEKVRPTIENISESVYASGILKSKNQYQVYSKVSGLIREIYVTEGDIVKEGTPLLNISDETTKLNTENARLAADYSDVKTNASRLNELEINIDLAKSKMINDSLLLNRQKSLWDQQIGSKNDLERRELAFQNSKTEFESAKLRFDELNRQIKFTSEQSKNNLQISKKVEGDFIIKSDINGKVYNLLKEKGEMVSPQTPLAIVGDADNFILELQVDEYDIVRVRKGQKVLVSLDSYKDQVFEAIVDKVYPIMNERSKTFTVEAIFTSKPPTLFPNLNMEANIVIQVKNNVLTIPRKFISDGDFVVKSNGDTVKIQTGLKDYQKAEIISGIKETDELIIPKK